MPSTNQNAAGGTYANEAERFLKCDHDIAPLIRGINDQERALMYWNTANRLDVDKGLKEQIQERMDCLRDAK